MQILLLLWFCLFVLFIRNLLNKTHFKINISFSQNPLEIFLKPVGNLYSVKEPRLANYPRENKKIARERLVFRYSYEFGFAMLQLLLS